MGSRYPVHTWTTRAVAAKKQFSSWQEAVSDTHLAWDLPKGSRTQFDAQIHSQTIGASSVIDCACDPCGGRRGTHEIARSTDAYYGVLHLLRGKEMIRQGGREAWLEAGDFTLWDSTRPIDFTIGDTLHKLTVLVPQNLLNRVLPNAQDRVARVVSGKRGCGALFTSHLRALAKEREHIPDANLPALVDATLELLASALAPEESLRVTSNQQSALARIQSFILSKLDDPELNPDSIAAAHGISARQLHRIFETTDCTVERWMWLQRLTRCRHELLQPGSGSISTVAFKWGFSDAAHFSRSFREQFGVSPREFRKQSVMTGTV